ncbi:hypothetical protein ABFS83_06G056600 [Erythranthe nasuta]
MGQCWTKLQPGKHSCLWPSCKRGTKDETVPHDLTGGNVRLINTMEKWEKETSEAYKDGKIVVVNFSASWCSPCRQITTAYSELADKYPAMLFLTVDVDDLAEFSNSWDIKATPTFYFLREGRQLDKLVGANKVELHKKTMAISESNN